MNKDMRNRACEMGIAIVFIVVAVLVPAEAETTCHLTIESNDQMQFNQRDMQVPASCGQVTVTLKHVGSLPKASMGHNWVLTDAANIQIVANAGAQAGIDKQFVPDNAKVYAATKLIGGGEETSVTFDVSTLKDKDLVFFCSFPGHWSAMKGTFDVQ